MNEEDEGDQVTDVDMVEGTIEVTGEMKMRKATSPSGVNVEMITANGDVGVLVIMK